MVSLYLIVSFTLFVAKRRVLHGFVTDRFVPHRFVTDNKSRPTDSWPTAYQLGASRNIAKDDEANVQINLAFSIAATVGFKVFFSFDYARNGYWDKAQVISLINAWKGYDAYYKRGSQPLVSTFEGSGAAGRG